jgi:hypothetical protein
MIAIESGSFSLSVCSSRGRLGSCPKIVLKHAAKHVEQSLRLTQETVVVVV